MPRNNIKVKMYDDVMKEKYRHEVIRSAIVVSKENETSPFLDDK